MLRLYNADILQHLVHLRLAKGNARRLRLQHQRYICLVLRQIPTVWLVRHTREPKLIKCRKLTHTGTCYIVICKTKNVTRQIAHCILC